MLLYSDENIDNDSYFKNIGDKISKWYTQVIRKNWNSDNKSLEENEVINTIELSSKVYEMTNSLEVSIVLIDK